MIVAALPGFSIPTTPHAARDLTPNKRERAMPESVYKIIELVGTSTESWEKAATAAVTEASKSLRDLRVAEVAQLDMHIEDGKVKAYRAKLKVSFKFEGKH
jgi:flavin-binding protein dodecin